MSSASEQPNKEKPDKQIATTNQEVGYVKTREITEEIGSSYLDYAMSVIVSRALPDVRDGLKPVHRRILYTMHEDGLRHNVKFRKSATVVGSCLGRYHPHGDVAVYDSLTRMAQDFSLRYPLIQGQGNFGCFTADTKVKLTDGRDLSFEELVGEYKTGKKNFTYTINNLGLISVAEIKKPRLTKKQTRVVRVILDNGAEIRCTPNHLFMLKNGEYKEAQYLQQRESLMPFYQKVSEQTDRLNREGYVLIYQNKTNEWVPAHHLADNYNLTLRKYKKNIGRVRHHIDFNKLNNDPSNIIRMNWQDHWRIHYEHASQQHRNEEYRNKIAEGRRRYWADPENKNKQSKALSVRNIRNWQDPQYKERMRVMLSEVNKKYIANHPEKRKELSERATETLKRLWRDPLYRSIFHEKIIKGNKNHTTNRTGKLKFLRICQVLLNEKLVLNADNYSQFRNKVYSYGGATSWQVGLSKYFENNCDLIYQEINQNHKIVAVKEEAGLEDVFDLTIDNSHNFCLAAGVFVHNSIDGDSSASMRYTECRLSKIGEEMLRDIEKETVDFTSNYDATRKEPLVLPSPFPQLLLNGSLGIAVGMATNIPPHNLSEVLQAAIYLIDHPDSATEDLLQFIKGPDFPTGGVIYGKKDIIAAYSQGRGPILVRGKAEIDENQKGYPQIIITEIPYQTQKSALVLRFAKMVEEKRLDGVKDIRDESGREGIRIVIELKREAFPRKVLNALFKYADLQKTFHLNMIALVDGLQPKVLSLVDVLSYYLLHKEIVLKRRLSFDLEKAKQRAHILEGLMIALDNIDAVIKTIKQSESREAAKINLQKKFKLSEAQAVAILEMKLQQLAKMERERIIQELAEIQKIIKEIEAILKSEKRLKEEVKKELQEMEEKFRDARRTKIVASSATSIGEEDLIPSEQAIVSLTRGGYIKRVKPSAYKLQKRGGAGVAGMDVSIEDQVEHFLVANNLDKLLFFTNSGKAFQCLVWEIAEMKRTAKGRGLLNFLEISQQEKILGLISYNKQDEEEGKKYLVLVTKNGIIKRTELAAFENVRKNGIMAIKLQEGDSLKQTLIANNNDEIILATKQGQSIRFKVSDIRAMGRSSAGVRGIRLDKGDEVVGMSAVKAQEKNSHLLIVMENGYAKRTKVEEYRLQKRGGGGVKAAKINEKTGKIVFAKVVSDQEKEIIIISNKGQVIRSELKSISIIGRASSGVRVMRLKQGDRVACAICFKDLEKTETEISNMSDV